MANYRQEIENYLEYWNTIYGLIAIEVIFLSLYFGTIKELIKETILDISKYALNFFIPLTIIVLIFLFWAFKSHRVGLFKKKRLTIGLFFSCDDFDKIIKIKKIIEACISEIEGDYKDIKIKFYPINYIKNKNSLEKFIARSNHLIDTAFFAKIKYGKTSEANETIEKIQICDLLFSGKFDVFSDVRIFKKKISIVKDLSLRNLNNDWNYIESKSFDDQDKIKHNLKDLILFYSGIYLIHMGHLDSSLDIMTSLKKSENVSENDVVLIKNGRLNLILLELFSFNALREYLLNKNRDEAYKILKDCEVLFKNNHPYKFEHSLTLSRISYELGKMNDAYFYTEVAESLNKSSTAIYCNNGYFGMIENNVNKVVKNYKELSHTYRHRGKLNFVEIIEFINIHKERHPESKILFEFSIGALNLLYADEKTGITDLENVKSQIINDLQYVELLNLINELLSKGAVKSSYFMRDKKSKVNRKAS